jgi:hypothetical protein
MASAVRTLQIKPVVLMPGWQLGPRIAFRFCFLYFGLFCLSTQILVAFLPIPKIDIPDFSLLWQPIVFWTAAHVFSARLPLVSTGSGSGDKTFDWVLVFCLLVFSIVATAVWSVLDRKRSNYAILHKWFRVFIRFSVAGQMLSYGMANVIPLQMPFPYLTQLLEPFGNFSPMGVLWSSIGSSRGYEVFAGCAGTLAGGLLVFARTTPLGALLGLVEMTDVFMLNMTYDVPVKLFSLHLILLNLFLLAPELRRLINFFIRNAVALPSPENALFEDARGNRIAFWSQVALGVWLLAMNLYGSGQMWFEYGGGREKSPLYGIWNVRGMSIDGRLRPLLLTDEDLWRNAVFDFPERMTVQRMNGEFTHYKISLKMDAKTLELTRDNSKNAKASFTFQQPEPGQLVLNGMLDGHKVHIQLEVMDRNRFLLVNRGFHWVQEYPFNR